MFSGRGRRVAACTALALSAGMLLSTPASAAEPAPSSSAEKQAPSFTPPKQLPRPGQDGARAGATAAEAVSPLLSDLNGDGIEDLIFRAIDGQLYTDIPGEETFELHRYQAGVAKEIVPIGDQGGYTTEPEVLVTSEDGTLTLYQDVDPSGTPYEYRVGGGWQVYNKITSPGDVNGDGRADVVARTHDGQLYLYLATGDLAKPLGGRIAVGPGWGVYDQIVGVGDGNGDGRADLYARDYTGTLWWYAGTGVNAKPFGTRKAIGTGWNTYNQILPGGDGSLFGRDNSGTMYLYLPNGDGTLSGRQMYGGLGDFEGIAHFAGAGSNPYTGKEGAIGRDSQGTLWWYTNNTKGGLYPRDMLFDTGWFQGVTYAHLSSMNPDASSDVAVVDGGELWIEGNPIGTGWGIYNTLVGPGDLSGDGKADLLARDKSGVLYLYKGDGTGEKLATRIRVGSGWGAYNKILGAGDYTGDGRTDLLARTTGGDLYLYPGTGNATTPFKTRIHIGGGWNTYKHLAAPGDLNSDGKADLLGVATNGDLYRYLGTSPNKFSARAKLGPGYQIYNTFS
ncbi:MULTISPECIES: VCBS repeat-containing protein [Streptomyces]|uniref:VCBS repeat-containing protein n=2 Tax=Streptomyces TaxID=1883 RepID=A0ABU4KAT4_9ACTN|nr:VCBS repeat-containing protein [Streptomyces roseolus]MDX2294892.1 VCBS repeat-containing protein [Streptomyces roseolus]